MKITVAICTWNRSRLLDQTLAALQRLVIPEGVEWELLVVNNNCTDDTDEVIARHAAHLPLRRLCEHRQGHSQARNCAIAAAEGELIVWTDDDVLVDPYWFVEYVKAARAYPDAGYFGGSIDPWFSVPPPRWVVRNLGQLFGPFALRQLGPEVRWLHDEMIFGANMAFRAPLLKDQRFDPQLGRVGANMVSGDETELIQRLRDAGHKGLWVGTARVRHYVPAERLTTKYLWSYLRGSGQTAVRRNGTEAACPRLWGVPRWALKQYCLESIRCWFLSAFKGRRWLASMTRAAHLRGLMDEYRSMARPSAQTKYLSPQ